MCTTPDLNRFEQIVFLSTAPGTSLRRHARPCCAILPFNSVASNVASKSIFPVQSVDIPITINFRPGIYLPVHAGHVRVPHADRYHADRPRQSLRLCPAIPQLCHFFCPAQKLYEMPNLKAKSTINGKEFRGRRAISFYHLLTRFSSDYSVCDGDIGSNH